jgi:hypothetical protein
VILASGEDIASTGILHGNSTIRIFGIYPAVRGKYPTFFSGDKCTGHCSSKLNPKHDPVALPLQTPCTAAALPPLPTPYAAAAALTSCAAAANSLRWPKALHRQALHCSCGCAAAVNALHCRCECRPLRCRRCAAAVNEAATVLPPQCCQSLHCPLLRCRFQRSALPAAALPLPTPCSAAAELCCRCHRCAALSLPKALHSADPTLRLRLCCRCCRCQMPCTAQALHCSCGCAVLMLKRSYAIIE